MLKLYRAAVVGTVCTMAAIVVTGLMSLEGEQPKEDANQVLTEQKEPEDRQRSTGNLLLACARASKIPELNIEIPEESEKKQKSMVAAPEEDILAQAEMEPEPEIMVLAEPEEETAEEPTAEPSEFDGYVLPVVDVYLNIRDQPSTEGTVLGKLYVGSMAKIIEVDGKWTKISSGSVEGYVSNEYIVTGTAAEELARQDGRIVATVLGNGINVRENPGLDADVLNIAGEGEQFEVAEEADGWIGIRYTGDITAYMSADYVSVDFMLGEAISIEEEREAIRKAQEEAERKAAEQARAQEEAKARAAERLANSQPVDTVITEGYNANYDDAYLLACLVHMEAGAEPYEGKLAVANVVLNRLKSGYGSTISEVIYAKGQFTGANTGALANRLAKGPNDECLRAASEALAGVNNIGDYRNFIGVRSANYGAYSSYTIIGNHCFYKR